MKFKKFLATAFSCGLLFSSLAAASPITRVSAQEDVTISYWGFPNFTGDSEFPVTEEYDAALIAAFQEKYPHITVDYQKIDFTDGPTKLETAIQSNTNPDVVYDAPGRVIDWASKGYLVPFDEVDTATLNPSAVEASSYDGSLYLYPQGVAPFLMAVNTQITDELDLTEMLPLDDPDNPGRNWTVEEYQAFLEAVQEADETMIPAVLYSKSAAGDQGPRAFVSNLFSSWITNDEVTEYIINNEGGVQGLTWIQEVAPSGILGQGTALEAKDALEYFKSGKAATTILYSPGLYAQDLGEEGLTARFVAFPNVDESPRYEYLVAGPAIFDNGDEARIEAAKLFVDFMINDEDWGRRTLLATGNFSAKLDDTGLYADEELLFAETLSANFGPYYNTIAGFARMRPLWFPMLQGVLTGDVDPAEAVNTFVEEAQAIYEEEINF